VCSTQVGFAGANPYDRSASVHPVAVFERDDAAGHSYFQSVHPLPSGWTLTPDSPAGTSWQRSN
jgi:hypothetical protein